MYIRETSLTTRRGPPTQDPIHLFLQYFVPTDPKRAAEVRYALLQNVQNGHIESIVMLNERVYTPEELGTDSPKIEQVVLGRWLKFSDFFDRVKPGYNVLSNSDIFFDNTLGGVRESDLHSTRSMYALLRYEYRGEKSLDECQLFGPRGDSMDTWIVHSNNKVPPHIFNFELGRPGCDNKLCYLFKILGYNIYNDPKFIKSYHYHTQTARNYKHAPLSSPLGYITPADLPVHSTFNKNDLEVYHFTNTNTRLRDHIRTKLAAGEHFIVPRIAGIENNVAVAAYQKLPIPNADYHIPAMKNNAGIHFTSHASTWRYGALYLEAFRRCEMYASWDPWGNYIGHVQHSHNYIVSTFKKPQIWALTFDIYHYLNDPWTHALANKRILIVSAFAEMIKTQPKAYDVDLFPGCTFEYVIPPQTQAGERSREWSVEFDDLCAKVAAKEFDVALCSCGGYGNPLCAYIHSIGKSAIYVGGVLQMYFGIYGGRWLHERKDIMDLYLRPGWRRPDVKPVGFAGVEGGCYW
jgi:hypothetical protein